MLYKYAESVQAIWGLNRSGDPMRYLIPRGLTISAEVLTSDKGKRMMFEMGRNSLSASPSANPVSDIEEVQNAKNDNNQSVCPT